MNEALGRFIIKHYNFFSRLLWIFGIKLRVVVEDESSEVLGHKKNVFLNNLLNEYTLHQQYEEEIMKENIENSTIERFYTLDAQEIKDMSEKHREEGFGGE